MGLRFAALFEILWRHPLLLFGAMLLFLTPSLIHVILYFSPLLMSTGLFIVALISMGPKIEETREEGEKWAKGDKIADQSQSAVYQPHEKKTASWVEETKSKFGGWMDSIFKAGDWSSFKYLKAKEAVVGMFSRKNTTLLSPATSREEHYVSEDDEEIAKNNEYRFMNTPGKGLGMPELEHFEAEEIISDQDEEQVEAVNKFNGFEDQEDEIKAAYRFNELEEEPVWDDDCPIVEKSQEFIIRKRKVTSNDEMKRSKSERGKFRFPKDFSPTSASKSFRDVNMEIVKNMHTKLNDLQAKRREQYSLVLSRRGSSRTA